MRKRWMVLFPAMLWMAGVGGCSNSFNLRYKAEPQPAAANLFADYSTVQDGGIGVSVDTDGRRLEEIFIKKPDGTVVRPVNVAVPNVNQNAPAGAGTGMRPAGTGTGMGMAPGPEVERGVSFATFKSSELGEPPWEVHVKVQGVPEAVIPGVGGKATAK